MTYASKLEALVGTGNDTEVDQAEGIAFFRTIAPMLPAADAEAITQALMEPAKGVKAKVGARLLLMLLLGPGICEQE